MTDKEQIIDELYGALSGIFLMYNISLESVAGQTILNILKEIEEHFNYKTHELYLANNEISSKTKYIQEQRDEIKQLEQEYQKLADILRDTDTYSEVCNACKDDILIYPSISDKTNYTDNEVDAITLRRIINILEGKTQEYEELKRKVKLMMDCPDCKVDEYKKSS